MNYKKAFYSKLEYCYLGVKIKDFHKSNTAKSGLECIEYISLDCKNIAWESSSEKIIKNSFIIKNGMKIKEFWNSKITSSKKPLRLKIRNIYCDKSVIELRQIVQKRSV